MQDDVLFRIARQCLVKIYPHPDGACRSIPDHDPGQLGIVEIGIHLEAAGVCDEVPDAHVVIKTVGSRMQDFAADGNDELFHYVRT